MIAINQLVDIRLSLRTEKKNEQSDLNSVASLQPQAFSACKWVCFTSIAFSLNPTFSDDLFLLKSKSVCPCYRSAGLALGLSVKFLCLTVVCG